jgi:hypothetical protein
LIGIEQRIQVAEGTPDDWRAAAEEWRELGATHLSVATMRGGLDADGHIRVIAEAIEAIRS